MYSYTYSYPYTTHWTSDIFYYSQAFVNVQQPQKTDMNSTKQSSPSSSSEKSSKRSTVMRPITNEKPPQNVLPIRIVELDVKIENRSTTIDEKSSAVLKYRTPHFRASATLKFPPLDENTHWKIGWIQSCTRMDFFNSYGDSGYSSWEFPQLMSGQNSMISDSDGRNYPFYGSKSEVIDLYGPASDYQTVKVQMNDNFYPHITWDIPTSSERLSRLTHVKRHQNFYTWLVAMNVRNGSILVLKTISWQMNLEINVDPTKPQGYRATLISDPVPIQPEILKQNIRIPTCVLHPPNANSAQILVWHPGCRLGEISKRPEIVVPPRCLSVLQQNPFYDHYIRHKTHTSVQNKLNSGSSSSSENRSQSSTSKPYSRVIYPPTTSSKRCCNEIKQMLENHAKLAQTVTVR